MSGPSPTDDTIKAWLAIAARPTVTRRALAYALVVGPILIAINHGDALLRTDIDAARLGKMLLTLFVPYCVSTFSSVGAIRAQSRQSAPLEAEPSSPASAPQRPRHSGRGP